MLVGSDKVAGTIVQDNKIIFKLTPEYQTVGITELQIVLIEMQDLRRSFKASYPYKQYIKLIIQQNFKTANIFL